MKKLALLIGALAFILITGVFASTAKATYCYQETANASTVCGGLSGGYYSSSVYGGAGWSVAYPWGNTFDGDWNTYGQANTTTAGSNVATSITYKKPANANGNSIWMVKLSNDGVIHNFSIQPDCWDYNSSYLFFLIQSRYSVPETDAGAYCHGISGWQFPTGSSGLYGNNTIWEEAMNWSVSDGGYCGGTSSACSSFNTTFCTTQTGCSASSGQCLNQGTGDCNDFNQDQCNTVATCEWVGDHCSGGYDCSSYNGDQASCEFLSPSCSWSLSCTGNHASCNYYGNQTSCQEQSNCIWTSSNITVTITSPIQNGTYHTSGIPLNVTADKAINTWWYSLNGGSNVTFTPNSTITAQLGDNNIVVFANDSSGNIGIAAASFSYTVTLNITYVSPTPPDGSFIRKNYFEANVSSNGTLSSCSIVIDGQSPNSMTIVSGSLSAFRNNTGLPDGLHNYNVTCDSIVLGGRQVNVDTSIPNITIYSPQNTSYNTVNIPIQLSASEPINTWNYSLNGGVNTTLIPILVPRSGENTGNGGGTNLSNIVDGNWNTFGTPAYYYNIQFVIPPNIANSAATIWQVKDEQGYHNLTIPDFCWNISNGKVIGDVYVSGNVTYWKCYDSSLAVHLLNSYSGDQVYDSLMWFDVISTNITANQGNNNISVFANDSGGNIGMNQVFFFVDTVPPTITIYSPQNITYNNVSQVNLNVSANKTISTWWYSINGGDNTTFSPNSTINIANGSNTLIVYANDTVGTGNIGSATISFTSNFPASATLNTPLDAIVIESSLGQAVNMSFNCSATNDINLANISFYFSGGGNAWHLEEIQNVTGVTNTSIFSRTMNLGSYVWSCFACDYQDQCAWAVPNRTFIIQDTTPPIITIYSPQNISYNTTSIPLQVSANEATGTWWYSLNAGANVFFTPNTTVTGIAGFNQITVFANDTSGNTGSSAITFNTPTPSPTGLFASLPVPFNIVAGFALGAGFIMFAVSVLFATESLADPKRLILAGIAILVVISLIAAII
jgi:hypothetical protein